jgi:hypothetical protein
LNRGQSACRGRRKVETIRGSNRKVIERVDEVVEEVEGTVVESKAVEVIDKVEEPGVDAKVVEGPDLARSQLLEKIRRLEETKEGPDLRIGPSLAPRADLGPDLVAKWLDG